MKKVTIVTNVDNKILNVFEKSAKDVAINLTEEWNNAHQIKMTYEYSSYHKSWDCIELREYGSPAYIFICKEFTVNEFENIKNL